MTAPRPLPIATTFCSAEIPLFDGLSFFVDGNSKITRENGTYKNPKPNAFSLPAASVDSPYAHLTPRACPGSTPSCRSSCYVKGLAKHAPDLYARYLSNADALATCLATDRGFFMSAITLAMWIEEHAAHGFRWHVSGDVWDTPRHADWIVEVCRLADRVPFWIYTRTLSAVPVLSGAPNLAVNVSADADNWTEALAVARVHGARVCYLTTHADHDWDAINDPRINSKCMRCGALAIDGPAACVPPLPEGSVIFPDYALRGRGLPDPTAAPWWQGLNPDQRRMMCPTDFFGQSEAHRCGPCRKCF